MGKKNQQIEKKFSSHEVKGWLNEQGRIEHAMADLLANLAYVFGVVVAGVAANSNPAIKTALYEQRGRLLKAWSDLTEGQARIKLYDEALLAEIVLPFIRAMTRAISDPSDCEPLKALVEKYSAQDIRAIVETRYTQGKRGAPSKATDYLTRKTAEYVQDGHTIQQAIEWIYEDLERKQVLTTAEKRAKREIQESPDPVDMLKKRLQRLDLGDKIILSPPDEP